MLEKLKKLNVKFKVDHGCACSKSVAVYTYVLPIRIDSDIAEAMKSFGNNVRPFNKTRMLKIETPEYSIIGVDKLRELKFTFKKNVKNMPTMVKRFEEALAFYILGKKVK